MNNSVTTTAFDADGTLWINQPYFQDAEKEFRILLEDYLPQHSVAQELILPVLNIADIERFAFRFLRNDKNMENYTVN